MSTAQLTLPQGPTPWTITIGKHMHERVQDVADVPRMYERMVEQRYTTRKAVVLPVGILSPIGVPCRVDGRGDVVAIGYWERAYAVSALCHLVVWLARWGCGEENPALLTRAAEHHGYQLEWEARHGTPRWCCACGRRPQAGKAMCAKCGAARLTADPESE